MKEWLTDNYAMILTVLFAVGSAMLIALYAPRNWLLWAVLKAETELGGGTGKLKLLMVYNLFIEKFPFISKIMPFKMFSILVDKALEKMKEILQNDEIQNIVETRSTI